VSAPTAATGPPEDPSLGRAGDLLLVPAGRRESAAGRSTRAGYLDLLGGRAVVSTGRAQDLMLSRVVPRIYERWWRPALGRLLKGPLGPSMADEHRLSRELLRLERGGGATVLDIACGTGNFSRGFGRVVGPGGLVIGIDVSETMLARAASDTRRSGLRNVAYVRGDAEALPFIDGVFDGVCCFAALHLFADPMSALDRMHAVLRPGGRLAILTSARRAPELLRAPESAFGALSGMRVFGQEELRDALHARGFDALEWQLAGAAQIVAARRA
jgi:ubiquinone/menaquinone biosynthesis C-methylase UbiE